MMVIEKPVDKHLLMNDLKNLTSGMLFTTLKIAACTEFIVQGTKFNDEENSNYWQKVLLHSFIILRVNAILSSNNNAMGCNAIEFYNRTVDAVSFYYRVNKKDNGELALLLARLREILNI
jgi:hypothetical protein